MWSWDLVTIQAIRMTKHKTVGKLHKSLIHHQVLTIRNEIQKIRTISCHAGFYVLMLHMASDRLLTVIEGEHNTCSIIYAIHAKNWDHWGTLNTTFETSDPIDIRLQLKNPFFIAQSDVVDFKWLHCGWLLCKNCWEILQRKLLLFSRMEYSFDSFLFLVLDRSNGSINFYRSSSSWFHVFFFLRFVPRCDHRVFVRDIRIYEPPT